MDDRVEQLERRVAELEALVRQLAARALPPARPSAPASVPPPAPRPAPPVARPPVRRPASPLPTSLASPPAASRNGSDFEQWIGQRGLLAVGVLALLATAGFFVKYAIDQGWISPLIRVNLGVLAGVAIAVWGDRLAARGGDGPWRAYGAAIVGGGGGVAYLAVWAAAAEYALISPTLGLGILTGISAGVASRAVHHRVEALAIWAMAGAFFAPLFVPNPDPNLSVLLAYLFVVGVSGAAVAVALRWRVAFALALAGYFLIPAVLARGTFAEGPYVAYLAVGGMAAFVATEAHRWYESRFSAFLMAWAILIPLSWALEGDAAIWLAWAAGAALAGTIWLRHCALDPFTGAEPVEAVLFVATPVTLMILSANTPALLGDRWELVPLALALPYFLAGWPRRATAFVATGFALLAIAVAAAFTQVTTVAAWAALGLGAVAADRRLGQRAGRGVALWLLGLASVLLVVREVDTAFTGAWARAWYLLMACAAIGAHWWPHRPKDAPWLAQGAAAMWGIAGTMLFIGGTMQLARYFGTLAIEPERARFMGNLAVSAFWIAYAGTLVRIGFWLGRQPVRAAGLAVAGLAVVKIAFYDLANLEALYRVGSFFVLAVVTLAVAYAYTQRAKSAR